MAGKYRRIYLAAGGSLFGLFLILAMTGLIITTDKDEIICAGTIDSPCISYITIRNPTAKSVYIYNYEEVKLSFSPEIEDYKLYVKYYGKWRYTNFTMATRLGNIPKDRKYIFVFPRYSTKYFKLVGYKKNITDTVKWSFETNGKELDPEWKSINTDTIFKNLKYNKAFIDRGEAIFEFYNPSNKAISTKKLSFNLENMEVYLNLPYNFTYLIYKEVIKEICDTANETTKCFNQTSKVEIGTKTEVRYKFQEVTEIPSFYKGDVKIIKRWKPSLGKREIEWIPSFEVENKKFTQIKWAWWNTSYGHRMNISCADCPEGLPFMVNGTGFSLDNTAQYVWAKHQSGGMALYYNNYTDYVIANGTTQLSMEIESGNSTSYNPSEVWDDDFLVVYHMSESSGDILDSTSNQNNATNTTAPTNYRLKSRLGYGIEFSGDGYFTLNSSIPTITTNTTISVITKNKAVTSKAVMGEAGDPLGYLFYFHSEGALYMGSGSVTQIYFSTYNSSDYIDLWTYSTIIYNGTTDGIYYYLNGTYMEADSLVCLSPINSIAYGSTHKFNGTIDEIQISNTTRDATWIKYTWNTTAKTLAAEETYTAPAGTDVNMTLNGLDANRTYEWGTKAKIKIDGNASSANFSVNGVLRNSSMSLPTTLNYTVNDTRYTKNNNSQTEFNFSSDDTFYIEMNNETDLISAHLNLTGFGGSLGLSLCDQETANVSTSCGGLATGSYNSTTGITNAGNFIDGDWSTTSLFTSNNTAYYINYTKPIISTNKSLWQVKDINATVNLSITACWSQSPLQFKAMYYEIGGNGYQAWYCYNGTAYKSLRDTHTQSNAFYEEKMIWNMSSYPDNITIDSANDGTIDAILKGELRGDNLYIDEFVYSNSIYTAKNLSYSTAGSKTIYINVSSDGNFKDNLTFEISGFDINPEAFNFEDDFLNITNISSGLSENINYPTTIWDGFERNTTNDYTISKDSDWDNLYWTSGTYNNDFIYVYDKVCLSCEPLCTDETTASLTTKDFDVKNYKSIKFKFYEKLENTGLGQAHSRHQIYIYDGTTAKFISEDHQNRGGTIEKTVTWELRKGDNNYTWSLYEDSTLRTTVDCSSLDSTQDWQIKFIYNRKTISENYAYKCTSVLIYLYEFNTSSVSLITNRTSDTYNTTLEGNVTSKILHNFTNDITSAILKSNYEIPTNTSIDFYLSADRKSWESVVVGETHIFVTQGKNISWKAILNTTDLNVTPRINSITINVVPGAAENITIDLGDDTLNIWEYNLTLNASTSPQNVSMNITDLEFYISDNCEGLTCLVPIKISTESSGTIEANTLNLTYNPNPINLNHTLLDGKNGSVGFNVSFDNGILQIDDIDIHYKGDGTVNLSACYGTTCDNKTITVRYSKFNLSLPDNVDYWEVFPSSNTEKNVTPYGQSSSVPIWNVTSMADYNFSLYVWVNESLNSCLNVSFSNHSNRTGEILVNLTQQKVYSNLTSDSHFGLWNWVDLYNCSARFYIPYFSFSSLCAGCVESEQWWLANLIEG